MRDTSPEVAARFAGMLLSRTPAERQRMASSMFEAARVIVRATRSDSTEAEARVALFRLIYGADFDASTRERIEAHLRRWRARRADRPPQGERVEP